MAVMGRLNSPSLNEGLSCPSYSNFDSISCTLYSLEGSTPGASCSATSS